MGLDITVADKWVWSFPYSAFNDWRDHIHQVSGCVSIESLDTRRRNDYGYWDETPDDAIIVLMAHHDDAGYIFPKEAEALKERIVCLMPKIAFEWRDHTRKFLQALTVSIQTGEPIIFG